MSAANLITNIPVFEGAQGKYYIVNDKKYSVYFPIAWAHEHITFHDDVGGVETTGPNECGNCDAYGSIRGVFVGYCGNCLQLYHGSQYWRGCPVAPGLSVEMLEDSDMWAQYPYMSGIPKSAIGDEEGADLTDQGINLEQLDAAIAAAEAREGGIQNEDDNDTQNDELPEVPEEELPDVPEEEAYIPIDVSEMIAIDEAYYGKKDAESSDEEVNEPVKEDEESYDEQSYDDGNGGSVYKNYFCEKCFRRHPKLPQYHCGDWQEGFMDC